MLTSRQPSVVVADPDPTWRQAIIATLEPHLRCYPAASLQECYHLIRQECPALVTIELTQPDGDGLALLRMAKELADWQALLVVCVTEQASLARKIAAFQQGAAHYFVKPINTRTFPMRIRLLLSASRMLQPPPADATR